MKRGLIAEIIGGVSTSIILIAYALLNFDYITGHGFPYQLMNFIGSIGIAYTAFAKKAKQPMILNIIWAIAALIAIGGILL